MPVRRARRFDLGQGEADSGNISRVIAGEFPAARAFCRQPTLASERRRAIRARRPRFDPAQIICPY
jgi:hypothetical protein